MHNVPQVHILDCPNSFQRPFPGYIHDCLQQLPDLLNKAASSIGEIIRLQNIFLERGIEEMEEYIKPQLLKLLEVEEAIPIASVILPPDVVYVSGMKGCCQYYIHSSMLLSPKVAGMEYMTEDVFDFFDRP